MVGDSEDDEIVGWIVLLGIVHRRFSGELDLILDFSFKAFVFHRNSLQTSGGDSDVVDLLKLSLLLVNDLGLEDILLLLIVVVLEGGHDDNKEQQHYCDRDNHSGDCVGDFRVNNLGLSFLGLVNVDLVSVFLSVGLVVISDIDIWVEDVAHLELFITLRRGNHDWVESWSRDDTVADNLDTSCSYVKNWSSEVNLSFCECLGLSFLYLGKFFGRIGLNFIVDNQGAFVDTDYLDGRSMDSEGPSDSVYEFGGSSVCEEFFHAPLHSDLGLDCVSGRNVNLAAGVQVELKDVLNTQVPVLSTEPLPNWPVVLDTLIPLVHFDVIPVDLDLFGFCTRESDSYCQTDT